LGNVADVTGVTRVVYNLWDVNLVSICTLLQRIAERIAKRNFIACWSISNYH